MQRHTFAVRLLRCCFLRCWFVRLRRCCFLRCWFLLLRCCLGLNHCLNGTRKRCDRSLDLRLSSVWGIYAMSQIKDLLNKEAPRVHVHMYVYIYIYILQGLLKEEARRVLYYKPCIFGHPARSACESKSAPASARICGVSELDLAVGTCYVPAWSTSQKYGRC